MGFFGFETDEEKRQEAKEEARRRALEKKLERLPLYFTAAVDFEYEIVDGGVYTWCQADDFEYAHYEALLDLKDQAYEAGADALIDVKVTIATGNQRTSLDRTGDEFFVVHATGVAVKRK